MILISKNLVEETVEKLIFFLSSHNLNIGDKLPNEYELADELNVGRSTIREAVRELVARNILEVKQGSGTYISARKGIANDPLGFSLVKNQDKMIQDLFELRFILEPPMAALAAKNASNKQINLMFKLIDLIEISFEESSMDHVKLDIELHKTIAEASGNIGLLHVVPIINESIALFNKNYDINQLKEETISLHRELVESIAKHDVIASMDAMTVHMANNRKEFKKYKNNN